MKIKEFWKDYETATKWQEKWEKDANRVVERYRIEKEGDRKGFNILWANTAVQQPALFSQAPKPDIRRRYRDDDPAAKMGAQVLERALEFVIDEQGFEDFGHQTTLDFLLPGRSVPKIRYQPKFVSKTQKVPVTASLGPNGEEWVDSDGNWVDAEDIQVEEGGFVVEQETEEIVDEKVVIERWPWKNFVHQKANRWGDVGWVDYISYIPFSQLKKRFGSKAASIRMATKNEWDKSTNRQDMGTKDAPTHAEVHEVWCREMRQVKVTVTGMDEWIEEKDDPLKLTDFYPCPEPLMSIVTNDSLCPIPLYIQYERLALELDELTRRIDLLVNALKVKGFYAGERKHEIEKIADSDDLQLIPISDWAAIGGNIDKYIAWWPIDEIGKVLSFLIRERQQIVQEIFELTGLADITRGVTDPRETRGAQQLKAQFAGRRDVTPQRRVEIYFRDCLEIAAEIIAEHFEVETLQRMTGLEVPEEVHALIAKDLSRQYRIDIETDSLVAPDEDRDKQQMAEAMQAVTGYMQTIGPLVQQGIIPAPLAIKLLKTYLRKFRFGREIESMLEELESQPVEQKDPEADKQNAEMQQKQAELQMEQQKVQAEMAAEQQKAQIEIQTKMAELQMKIAEFETKMAQKEREFEQKMTQKEIEFEQKRRLQAV